jgi:FkbM family methyltransferase
MLMNLFEIVNSGFNIKGVLHIGAHHGQEVAVYRALKVPSILFEPHPDSYRILTYKFENAEDVILENVAVGPETTTKTLYCETANQAMSCSLLKPQKHLEYYPHIKFESEKQINQISLDEYVMSKSIDLNVYNFINMDIQGYELEALKGSIETLKSIDHIMTEINFEHLYENCVLADKLDEFLSQFGFNRLFTAPTEYGWGDAFYSKVK